MVSLCEPSREERLGPLRALTILLLYLLEEMRQFLIALLLGVLDVSRVRGAAFEGMIEHADQIEGGVRRPRRSLPVFAVWGRNLVHAAAAVR